jgi:DHA2 family multidrug resistance protein-like MFS transporter
MLAPLLVRYVRPAFVVAGGLVLAAVGLGLLAQVDGDSPLALIVICSIVIALGVAPPVTLGTDLIVSCVRPERAGVASGLSETGAELGGALGIALLGSIGVAVYRSQVSDALPVGLAPGQVDAAEETLGGAREVVQGLEGVRGTALLESAQEAFAQGMRVAALIAAAVALGTALLAAIFLRQRGTRPPPERGRAPEAELAIEV